MDGRHVCVRERALLFGESKSLVGVVTEPAGDPRHAPAGVLFLNAGVLHRVGPNRLHVRLARRLAEAGFVCLRFDFSGIGDSRARTDGIPFARAAVTEVREGLDLLAASYGLASFILVGMCSGADNAVRVAGFDQRVVGLGLIEPYAVTSRAYTLWSYRHKLVSPRAWWRLLRGRSELVDLLRKMRRKTREAPKAPSPPAPLPRATRDAKEAVLPAPREVVSPPASREREIDVCFVYSADSPAYFNYRMVIRRKLRRVLGKGRVRVEVLRRTDHVFTPLAVQEDLLRRLEAWAVRLAGRSAATGPTEPPRGPQKPPGLPTR